MIKKQILWIQIKIEINVTIAWGPITSYISAGYYKQGCT